MNSRDVPPSPDLHDAVFEAIALDWATSTVVAHLRAVGPAGGHPVSLVWHDVIELHVPRAQPWGASASVLEVRSAPDGLTELVMQSGDMIRVRAARYQVRTDEPVALRYADVGVDALCDAGLVPRTKVAEAAGIVAQEIAVRRSMGDL